MGPVWFLWIVLLLQSAPAADQDSRGVLSLRSNYLLGYPQGPPGGPDELALRDAVAEFFNGSSRVLRTLVGGAGTATVQVEHRLSSLAEIEDVANALAQPRVSESVSRLGPVQSSWQEVFLEVEPGGPALENAVVVRLTFKCRPAAAAKVVDGLFALNEVLGEIGLPRGRILVGLLGGPSSPEVMLEGEFPDLVTLEKAMKQLQGDERYAAVLHSVEAVDVAEEVLVAVDASRPGATPRPPPED
jgi:hypothetical protein